MPGVEWFFDQHTLDGFFQFSMRAISVLYPERFAKNPFALMFNPIRFHTGCILAQLPKWTMLNKRQIDRETASVPQPFAKGSDTATMQFDNGFGDTQSQA